MATEQQIRAFINAVAPAAQNAYKTIGKVHPSVCIGMACVESAYGTAGSTKYNSFMGQKVGTGKTATKYWGGRFFTSATKEEYQIGVHTTIKAAFRAYDDLQQCINNYYELLNTSLYKGVQAGVSPAMQMAQIKACGYMTSSTEVSSVLRIIEKYNLTQYDEPGSVQSDENPFDEPIALLKRGMRGDGVRWLQKQLNIKGNYNLDVDGIFGAKTQACLMDFQNKHGLLIDGICGTASRMALLS